MNIIESKVVRRVWLDDEERFQRLKHPTARLKFEHQGQTFVARRTNGKYSMELPGRLEHPTYKTDRGIFPDTLSPKVWLKGPVHKFDTELEFERYVYRAFPTCAGTIILELRNLA